MHNDAPWREIEQNMGLGCSPCLSFIFCLDQFIDRVKDRKRHPHIMLIGVKFATRLFIKVKITYVSL